MRLFIWYNLLVNFIVDISHEKRKLICLLASTVHRSSEDASPGSGRGGAVGGGGAPLRYEYTASGRSTISPWNDATFAYSILQLYKGYNPLSKIEVVSSLNLFNQGRGMYYYTLSDHTQKYNPKVYIGTSQTIAYVWNFDQQTGINYPSIWPLNVSQKGEANISNSII